MASTEESRLNIFTHRESAAWALKPRELPVTLVTGFLGSGKTALLRHILTNSSNLRVAAAVNDAAAVNIDAGMISRVQKGAGTCASVLELSNGCLCCSAAAESDFAAAVWQVLQDCDVGKVQYLVVETSGVTDPHSIIRTLDQEFGRMFRVRLDSVVTVVDADVLLSEIASPPASIADDDSQPPRQYVARDTSADANIHMGTVAARQHSCQAVRFASRIAESQFQCADVVLLNKMDLVKSASAAEAATSAPAGAQNEEVLPKLTAWVEKAVGGAGVRVLPCERGAVPLDAIMEVAQTNLFGEDLKGVHTHERAVSNYTVRTDQFGSRRVGSRNTSSSSATVRAATTPGGVFSQAGASSMGSTGATATAAGAEYASAVWEGNAPSRGGEVLQLAAFQDFVGEALPMFKLMRAKGYAAICRRVRPHCAYTRITPRHLSCPYCHGCRARAMSPTAGRTLKWVASGCRLTSLNALRIPSRTRHLRFAGDESTGLFGAQSFLFHASGRQRFELRPESGTTGAIALALIGESHGVASALEALQSSTVASSVGGGGQAAAAAVSTATVSGSEWDAAAQLVANHPLFRVLGHAANGTGPGDHERAAGKAARANGWLLFRLSIQGAGTAAQPQHAVSATTHRSLTDRAVAGAPYHVNLNRLNEKLLIALNGSAGPAFLSSVVLKAPPHGTPAAASGREHGSGGDEVWLRWAIGGRLRMQGVWWEGLCAAAEAIVSRQPGLQAALLAVGGAGLVAGGQTCPKGEARLHMLDNQSH